MVENALTRIYTKFKLEFYQTVFSHLEDREESLTTVETFCMETIAALGCPTINEFATFIRISPSNAAYKVNSLIRKGYLEKRQSQRDKREYHLLVTPKFRENYNAGYRFLETVSGRMAKRFKPRELRKLKEMLEIISNELMPEISLPEELIREEERRPIRKAELQQITSLSKRSMRVKRLGLAKRAEGDGKDS